MVPTRAGCGANNIGRCAIRRALVASDDSLQRRAWSVHQPDMNTSRVFVLASFALTLGCYAAHPYEPTDDDVTPPDRTVALGVMRFESGGVAVEGEVDGTYSEHEGACPSLSDDGRWLTTLHWTTEERNTHTATITDLSSGARSSIEIASLSFTCPTISGDGSTLVYFELGGIHVIDRATLRERGVVTGLVSTPAISDDGRRLGYRACDRRSGSCAPGARFLDLDSGTWETGDPDEPLSPALPDVGLAMSGDGQHLVYSVPGPVPDVWLAVHTGTSGESTMLPEGTGVGQWTGISDDGAVIASSRQSGPRSWDPGAASPVLDLAIITEGRVIEIGGTGTPTIPLDGLGISGDGTVVVFRVPSVDGPATIHLRLADGRPQLVSRCSSIDPPAVSEDGHTVAVGLFRCEDDPTFEPHDRTRVYHVD